MKESVREKDFIRSVISGLDEESKRMSPALVRRLQDARLRALDAPQTNWFRFRIVPRWVTAGGLATVTVLAAAVSIWLGGSHSGLQVKNPDEFEIVAAQEQLELYEDIDFYRWLADQPGGAGLKGQKR